MVTASLYSYFAKLWMLRTNANKPDHELMSIETVTDTIYLNDYKSASREIYSGRTIQKFEFVQRI